MCKLKSCLVLEDRIFCPDYDSHDRMLEELKIKDTQRNASTRFVRVELYPKDGDIFSDIDSWGFNIDQDIRPDWFFEELEKPKVVEAVKEWAQKHIFIGETGIELTADGIYYLKNCKSVTARGNSTVTARDNSEVTAYDNSTVTARENSTVTARGNSIVVLENNVFCAKRESIVLMDNSTLKDCATKTIYQAGG